MKEKILGSFLCILTVFWFLCSFAFSEELPEKQREQNNESSASQNSVDVEPQYTGARGYAVVSAARAHEIEDTERNERLWTAPVFERSGNSWLEAGEIAHKTEVIVLEQFLSRKSDSSVDGYLLVEKCSDGTQCFIHIDNFIFKEEKFVAKDGTPVYYYIYFPETINTAEKLPILLYFHGIMDTMPRHHGLGELLRTGQIKPKGIVVLPQAVRETSDANFHTQWYQNAVIELINDIAEKHNGDLNRLSVSGHSDGGTTVYQIVNGHPGVFAACAPISAIGNTGEGVKQTFLWVFQGERDWWVKPSIGLRVVLKCEYSGCNAMHYVYKNEGHAIQTMVFQDTFIDENGEAVKLIDWLMSKKLNE